MQRQSRGGAEAHANRSSETRLGTRPKRLQGGRGFWPIATLVIVMEWQKNRGVTPIFHGQHAAEGTVGAHVYEHWSDYVRAHKSNCTYFAFVWMRRRLATAGCCEQLEDKGCCEPVWTSKVVPDLIYTPAPRPANFSGSQRQTGGDGQGDIRNASLEALPAGNWTKLESSC